MKKKTNHLQFVKSLAKISGRDILPDVQLPKQKATTRKKRKKETSPRNMNEKQLEEKIIWALQLQGHEVCKSGESSTYNARYCMSGMSDLMVFVKDMGVIFLEVKYEKGKQRASQVKFQKLCEDFGLVYKVVRSVKEAVDACRKGKVK